MLEPVSFFKQNMTNHQSWLNKSIYQRELFALVASVKRNEYLLRGSHPVDIYCDNEAVVESKQSKSQQIRHFFDTLEVEYPNVSLKFCSSRTNACADILSRGKFSLVSGENYKLEVPIEFISPVTTRAKGRPDTNVDKGTG